MAVLLFGAPRLICLPSSLILVADVSVLSCVVVLTKDCCVFVLMNTMLIVVRSVYVYL